MIAANYLVLDAKLNRVKWKFAQGIEISNSSIELHLLKYLKLDIQKEKVKA